jgi:hypothetical protein
MGLRDAVAALLGVSAYQPPKGYGPEHDASIVEKIREVLGGNLASQPTTRLRWYLADLEAAQAAADAGDISQAAWLWSAMRRDGNIRGLMGTLTSGVVRLPKKFYGRFGVEDLKAHNGTRSVFDDMIPSTELATCLADGVALGVAVGELVDVPGRDFPVFVRQEPEFLRYRWIENRWYFNSVAGPLPITPGDGRWVLHLPGGRVRPWMHGLWPSLGRSYINKDHAMIHRANYGSKLANAARAAIPPPGATDVQRAGFLSSLIAWGVNTVFELPAGWDVKLIESNGKGYDVFQAEIDTCDKEIAIAITGQEVSSGGGPGSGFINADLFRSIRTDIIQEVAFSAGFTVNTQILPSFVAKRHGLDAIREGAVVEYDTARPRDLLAEAQAMSNAASAIVSLREALAAQGREIDIDALTTRFGIPIKGDSDGDGIPDREIEAEATSNPSEVAATVAEARHYRTQGAHDGRWVQ